MGIGGVDTSTFDFSTAYLEIMIKLDDEEIINFNTPILSSGSCVNGSFEIERPKRDTESSTSTINADSFIPKGFGIKRLGIADYLKVEQSLHAYVPGEVSHIENIMAREYKEKTTRRLRRQENTTTSSTDTEREKLTDTTSASRFEMQSEISKMLQESTDFGLSTGMKFSYGEHFEMNIGANFAHHQAKEESQRQAVTQSQDITTRALDRIVTKVHEERIEKIIEEYEENNKHGFDNTKGDKHVVSVYRWLDKRMKNQIYNYGKRMMFEFMIPEPARLHTLAIDNLKKSNTKVITVPVDPRMSVDFQMKDYTALANESTLNYWMSKYNVEIDNKPQENIVLTKSIISSTQDGSKNEYLSKSETIEIPEGYVAVKANVRFSCRYDNDSSQRHSFSLVLGDQIIERDEKLMNISSSNIYSSEPINIQLNNIKDKIDFAFNSLNYLFVNIGGDINCSLTKEAEKSWQQKTFNAIIQAYEDALAEYNSQLEQEDAKAKQISEENPNYYRQIEQEILKHNAIAFLTDDGDTKKLGLDLNLGVTSMADYKVNREDLDQYAALVKFMEQAFEWNIMSYNFYPYYWAGRKDWEMMHLSDSVDPLFRSFLQSGMARVIVTVKPGFEDAVNFYFTTGKIWNGGEVPVIGNPLYLSLADEIREPKGKKYGKAWATRVPTALTILQAQSIGLNVNKALPFNNDTSDFEDPTSVPHTSSFNFSSALIGQGDAETKKIQFLFKDMDGWLQKIGDFDQEQLFPRVYECMGETIEVDRDAGWETEQSSVVIFEELANKLNAIDGVQAIALPEGEQGISFVVDTSKIKTFDFRKPGGVDAFDYLKLSTDGKTFVKLLYPDNSGGYGSERILDRLGNSIKGNEVGKELNINRFLV